LNALGAERATLSTVEITHTRVSQTRRPRETPRRMIKEQIQG
jgi:hypothetical protein